MTDAEAKYDQTTTHQQSWTDKGVVQDSVLSGMDVDSEGKNREEVDGEAVGELELLLGGVSSSLVIEEEVGVLPEGSAELAGLKVVPVVGEEIKLIITPLKEVGSEEDLVRHTKTEDSISNLRELVDRDLNGYQWENDIVICKRHDELGHVRKQICVPRFHRSTILQLAHEGFGHQSKKKVAHHIQKAFYWPTMWKDVASHCRSCETCQRVSKQKPIPVPMVERDLVTIPFERLCVDIVGPLPKAKGGCEYLLTYIDSGSRWPEALPIKVGNTQSVITELNSIFSRNGFPRVLVSDNGVQFTSNTFMRYCSAHDIKKIEMAPYHPQSNGIVEQMHGTLVPFVHKYFDGKWPEMVQLALYFLRMTPNGSTGFSPYLIVHGWEPANPLEVLQQGWLEEELREMDMYK